MNFQLMHSSGKIQTTANDNFKFKQFPDCVNEGYLYEIFFYTEIIMQYQVPQYAYSKSEPLWHPKIK